MSVRQTSRCKSARVPRAIDHRACWRAWIQGCLKRTGVRSAGKKQSISAANVGGLFFPRTAELGLRVEATVSGRVERKLVYAGVCAESFGKASDHLRYLADLKISDERIRRATRRVGRERFEQRQRLVEEFLRKPLPVQAYGKPANVMPPPIACVMADGGRYQVLNRKKQLEKQGEHWRESRIATFLGMGGESYTSDPTPQLPDFLQDVSIAKTLAEIGRVSGKNAPETETPASATKQDPPWPRPNILHKTMQASAVCWEEFGPMMASHAWYHGFDACTAKVFVSDGSSAIEKVQKRYFSLYTSVLDLMHALSYALAAARAAIEDTPWERYVYWAEHIWQGNVHLVIRELDEIQQRIGTPTKDASPDDPKEVVRRARVYYQNHKERMDYPTYRCKGFPLTSSIMESSVKQVNRRVKGTEKFWSEGGGESILTLRADYLSDDQPIEAFWESQQNATGERQYRQAA